jgi:molybdate transport system substrate-binding protein
MKKYSWAIWLAGVALVVANGCGRVRGPVGWRQQRAGPPQLQELAVFVPCGIIVPMHAAIAAFEKSHPGVRIKASYDNPLALQRRLLKQPAACDVYLSPGPLEIEPLAARGLVDKSTVVYFGQMELVILVPRANPARVRQPADLLNAKTIACPDPRYNSLGKLAQDGLTRLGLWSRLKPKLVLTEYSIDTYKLVASGKAQAGIAYRSCPLESNPEKIPAAAVKVACPLPPDTYDRRQARFQGVITTASRRRQQAQAFLAFLSSAEAAALMAAQGLPAPSGAAQGQPGQSAAAKPKVQVVAFYPDTAGHADIKRLVLSLPQKFPGKVKAEFVDFTSEEGFRRWQAAGLSCGSVLINGKRSYHLRASSGREREVTFAGPLGGSWQAEDLLAAVRQEVDRLYGP